MPAQLLPSTLTFPYIWYLLQGRQHGPPPCVQGRASTRLRGMRYPGRQTGRHQRGYRGMAVRFCPSVPTTCSPIVRGGTLGSKCPPRYQIVCRHDLFQPSPTLRLYLAPTPHLIP